MAGSAQEAAPLAGGFHVDGRQGLIQNQDGGPRGERADEGHLGGLAAGKGGHGDIVKLTQARRLQQLRGALLIAGDHRNGLVGGGPRRQAGALGKQDDLIWVGGNLRAGQPPGDAPHECGLARAIGTDDGRDRARGKFRGLSIRRDV